MKQYKKYLRSIYKNDVYITRLVTLMIVWMLFMAIFKFDKFYSFNKFQTMASQFPEFGLMPWALCYV